MMIHTKLLLIITLLAGDCSCPSQTFGFNYIQPGEIVYIRGYPILGWHKLVWPYHYFYAITNKLLWNTYEIDEKKETGRLRTQVKIVSLDLRSESRDRKIQLKTQDPSQRGLSKELGSILAKRMLGLELPYELRRCNCRHYVDYVAYGKTFGSFWNPAYWPLHEECPLHRRITQYDYQALAADSPFFLQVKFRGRVVNANELNLVANFKNLSPQKHFFAKFNEHREQMKVEMREKFGDSAVPSASRQTSFDSSFQYPKRQFSRLNSPNLSNQ